MALVTVFSGSAVGYLYGKYGPSNVFLVISLIQLSALFLAIYLPKTEKNDSVSENYIDEMKKSFPGIILGISDHTENNYTSLASVALGANIVERHFTDTLEREGPDISCSMDPQELEYLIKKSKEIQKVINKFTYSSMKFINNNL